MAKTIDNLDERIESYVSKWLIRLGISGWSVELRYDLSSCLADSTVQDAPEYEEARLRFNTRRMRKESIGSRQLEHTVLHEVLHILLWEAIGEHKTDEAERNEERIVQRLTKALLIEG